MDRPMNTNRLLGWLIGLLASTFLCCACTGAILALSGQSPTSKVEGPTSPPSGTLDVAIDEAYLSRTLAQNARGYPSPWPITGGQMDVLPGNQATFDVVVDSPLGGMQVSGRMTFGVARSQLIIHIAEVRLGAFPLTPLMRWFAPDLETLINAKANQQLQERAGGAGVTLLGVTTDDEFLRFSFTGQ
jgi:hypothetical protein